MAARTAVGSGNWSDVATWDGGASVPGSGDSADSNGFTVTIDTNIDLSPGGSLINTNAGAGGFSATAARTIVANIVASVRTVLTLTHGSGTTAITGTIGTSSTAAVYGVYVNGAGGTTTIAGACSGGGFAGSAAVGVNAGTCNITGGVTGGSVATAYGLRVLGGVTTVDTVTGGSAGVSSWGAYNGSAAGTLAITTVVGGSGAPGVYAANADLTTYAIAQQPAGAFFPVYGKARLVYTAASSYIRANESTGSTIDLSNDYPAAADVRAGVAYKLSGLTGTRTFHGVVLGG